MWLVVDSSVEFIFSRGILEGIKKMILQEKEKTQIGWSDRKEQIYICYRKVIYGFDNFYL